MNSKKLNDALPDTIEAWFVTGSRWAHGDGVGINVADAHRAFAATYNLKPDDVPLLKLSPDNWEEPFSMLEL